MSARRRSFFAPLLLVGSLIASCGDEPAGGGLLLQVSRDGPLALDRLDFTIKSGERVLHEAKYRVPEEAALPTTFGITSNGDPTASVTITVTGWSKDQPLDRRDAIVTQVPTDRVALLKVVLSGRCTAQVRLVEGDAVSACGDGNTCDPSSGDCGSALVDGKSLPTFDPAAPLGEGGAPGDDGEGGAATAGGAQGVGGDRPSAGGDHGVSGGSSGSGGAGGMGGLVESAGAGGLSCSAGFDDCDENPSDCETNTATDVNNCGACGERCQQSSGHAYCDAGTCAETICAAPLADCNLKPSDGCEIDTTSADKHCLGCRQPCGDPTPFCTPTGCADHRDITLVSSDTVRSFEWDETPEGEAYRHTLSLKHSLKTPFREGDQGRLVIVGIVGEEGHLTTGSFSYDGVPLRAAIQDEKGPAQIGLYYLMDADLPRKSGSYSIELSVNSIPEGGLALQVLELKNVRQLGPIATSKSAPNDCSPIETGFGFSAPRSFTFAMAAAKGTDNLGPSLYPEPDGASEIWSGSVEFRQNISAVTYISDGGAYFSWVSEVCDKNSGVAATISFARYGNDEIALP